MVVPSRSRRRSAARARSRVWLTRRCVAAARWVAGSVVIIVSLAGFQRGDDCVEVLGDLAVVVGQAGVAASLGEVDEFEGVVVLAAVDGQEGRGGLEVRAGQARVGVRAVLLGRATAVTVGQGGLDA